MLADTKEAPDVVAGGPEIHQLKVAKVSFGSHSQGLQGRRIDRHLLCRQLWAHSVARP